LLFPPRAKTIRCNYCLCKFVKRPAGIWLNQLIISFCVGRTNLDATHNLSIGSILRPRLRRMRATFHWLAGNSVVSSKWFWDSVSRAVDPLSKSGPFISAVGSPPVALITQQPKSIHTHNYLAPIPASALDPKIRHSLRLWYLPVCLEFWRPRSPLVTCHNHPKTLVDTRSIEQRT
jgi:hypothetical protein